MRHAHHHGHRRRRLGAWLAGIVGLAVVGVLLYQARRIDWHAVARAAHDIPGPAVALAAALALAGYLAYAGFDILARRYAGHHLPAWQVAAIAMTSYALNLNLGVLLGGIAVRLRLYGRHGLRTACGLRVVAFATATNWVGYAWLAGILLLAGQMPTPAGWHLGAGLLRTVGAALLAGALAYLYLCRYARRRAYTLRGHRWVLPDLPTALRQMGLAGVSWAIMGGIIYVLLQGRAPYPEVLAILLFSSIAALLAHIPGGLGVIEALFAAALATRMPASESLGAVLMYRLLYAWIPLCVALPAYLGAEWRHRRAAAG